MGERESGERRAWKKGEKKEKADIVEIHKREK
jgi:hypothetical protein